MYLSQIVKPGHLVLVHTENYPLDLAVLYLCPEVEQKRFCNPVSDLWEVPTFKSRSWPFLVALHHQL
ncbi:hypothetical protein BC938DRAFT_483934 [Jimgerdemannia flammicorona]|uniref:Uncharacterized protein n=1 Tax=Jimgerdemannia flammicorona TaxID=994334 RepID=A0A433QAT8_9FUNG|nr:hypothetical protein BC938DRAFT_483934 [Jimgerdemannia flammicorona]